MSPYALKVKRPVFRRLKTSSLPTTPHSASGVTARTFQMRQITWVSCAPRATTETVLAKRPDCTTTSRYQCAHLHLPGAAQATRRLDRVDALTISATTYLEVVQGLRNKAEYAAVKKMLQLRNASILPLTESITLHSIELMELLTLSHGLQMGDALVAATALEHKLPLLTGNTKHFAAIQGLHIEEFSI